MREISLDELIEILEEFIDLSSIDITEETVIGEDVPVDSSIMLRVLSRIESNYSFTFAPSELLQIRTIGDLKTQIQQNL